MSRNLVTLSLTASLLAGTALAEVPQVAVDIAPVHSLVARVMDGVGEATLIVQPGASPHEYSLRPSEAAALQSADIVFWVGPDLTPWLDGALDTLAGDATVIELLESDGTIELPMREDALFEAHEHGDHDDHDEHEEHDEHAEDHDADHEGHDHGDHDPHAWLSPDNGAIWLNTIAATLSAADPDNAGAYYANATAGRAEIEALKSEIATILDPMRDRNFIVFHDAYQYFESAFDFPASGAISVSDATDPSPARIAEIQARVADQGVTCVLSEPQFNAGILAAVMDRTDAHTGVLDPLGSDLEPGAALYPQMLRNLATSLAECL
ncbi:zinc ABC transporter substrate-binding protein [Rhodobacteraceae bacterium KMM 6894]|nr:zinc ABC transporter substrate-binding protein [Rhodobacteraceae bacterium KMM 6894]